VIIRILGEGQFDVDDESVAELNRLDTEVEAAVEAGDDGAFRTALATLLAGVRAHGTAHAADSLDQSDLILPPEDASIAEVRTMLEDNEGGLIPD
jgi:hypothetical protein